MLRSLPLFAACSDEQLDHVGALVDECEVEAGEILTVEGKVARETFVIISGEAVVTRAGARAAVLGPGDIFSGLEGTVTARTPMKLLALDLRTFSRLLDEGVISLAR